MKHKNIMWLMAATQFLLLIDTSIINVVVPSIATDLGFSSTAQSWIANGYLIAFGGVLLLCGSLADILGRTRMFMAGLLVLALGSALGALAPSAALLTAGRVVQGLGAAMSAAASLALILSIFHDDERQKALGLVAAMAGAGGAAGTVLGGLLTQWWGWRSTFWVSVVAALVLFLLAMRMLAGVDGARIRKKIDVPGSILLIAGQVALAYGLVSLGDGGAFSLSKFIPLMAAALLLLAFQISQGLGSTPLVPLDTWRNAGLVRATMLAGIGQFVLFPMFFIANLYLQEVLHKSPFFSGMTLLPLCFVVIATAGNIGRIIGALGLHGAMSAGFLFVAIGLAWFGNLHADGSFLVDILGPTLIVGVGLPLVAISTNILAGMHASPGREGLTSGLLNTAQQLGAAAGVSALLGLASYYTAGLASKIDVGDALSRGYSAALWVAAAIAFTCAVYGAVWARASRAPATAQPDAST